MKTIVILILLLLPSLVSAQVLKEFDVKLTTNRGQIPIFRDFPDKAALIFYTKFSNLTFSSSYGIYNELGDPAGGKYIIIIEPTRQTIEIRGSGYKTEQIRISDLQPRDVLYYEVLPKKEEVTTGVSEVGITLQVTPTDASILLDGLAFTNNQTTKVTLGSHTLSIEKPGYASYLKEIVVTPDQTLFKIDLQKIKLIPVIIRSSPANATVFVNNENKGSTEVGFYLHSGTYDLRVELQDYVTASEKITVEPRSDSKENVFSFQLVKDKGNLKLSVIPTNAVVTINGNRVNPGSIELSPGKYTLQANANLHDSFREEIEITRGVTVNKDIVLSKNTGTLELQLDPASASVLINKENRSGSSFDLVPGIYEVEVSADTYHPEAFTVRIERGANLKQSVKLRRKVGGLQFTIKPLDARVTLSQNGEIRFSWKGMNLLDDVPEGKYDLRADAPGYKSISKQVVITEGNQVVENIQLTAGSDAKLYEMVSVEGGSFMMGNSDGEKDEIPVHRVSVKSFRIGVTEVTQELWLQVMGTTPSKYQGENRPVELVSWRDAVAFCNKLSEKEGLEPAYRITSSGVTCNFASNGYRLPTEAEWEFAARGGSRTTNTPYSGSKNISSVAWYRDNSSAQTHEVARLNPNELGLYDMSGNVWEWCWDWYDSYSSYNLDNPTGPGTGNLKVIRGGSWHDSAEDSRVSNRLKIDINDRSRNLGFRLVRSY